MLLHQTVQPPQWHLPTYQALQNGLTAMRWNFVLLLFHHTRVVGHLSYSPRVLLGRDWNRKLCEKLGMTSDQTQAYQSQAQTHEHLAEKDSKLGCKIEPGTTCWSSLAFSSLPL